MSKGVYYFVISLGLLGVLSSIVLFLLNEEQSLGVTALMFFNGVALAGVGYINMKKSPKQ